MYCWCSCLKKKRVNRTNVEDELRLVAQEYARLRREMNRHRLYYTIPPALVHKFVGIDSDVKATMMSLEDTNLVRTTTFDSSIASLWGAIFSIREELSRLSRLCGPSSENKERGVCCVGSDRYLHPDTLGFHGDMYTNDDPLCDTNKSELASCIGQWVTEVVHREDPLGVVDEALGPDEATFFHSSIVPRISINDYIERINKYGRFSRGVLIGAIIYLQRLLSTDASIVMTQRTAHRMLITVVMVSAKVHEDIHHGNHTYASIGGISNRELARLELQVLNLLEFELYVSADEYTRVAHTFAQMCNPVTGEVDRNTEIEQKVY